MDLVAGIATAVGVVGGITGTVLGIRAERRATRYKAVWAVRAGSPIQVINRTGEDASDVTAKVTGGRIISRPTRFNLVEPDESLDLHIKPDAGGLGQQLVQLELEWTRSSTGKRYRLPPAPRWWQRFFGWRPRRW